MARLSNRNKVVKCRRSSELEVTVGRPPASDRKYPPPCSPKCWRTRPLHITFNVHRRKLYFDSATPDSWSVIGDEQQPTGEKTVCLDRGFLEFKGMTKSIMEISDVLDCLNIKEYLQEGIVNQMLDYGTLRKADGKRMPKDLIVTMVFVYRFRGDRDSVHEVLQKSLQDRQSQHCAEGIKTLNITSDSISS